jgi:hypothetical protein
VTQDKMYVLVSYEECVVGYDSWQMLLLFRSIQLVDQGVSVATYLRQNVVQAVKTGDNVYRVKITEDTALQDNAKIELK